jgi:O-acetylserine/cysteine efflux transporter
MLVALITTGLGRGRVGPIGWAGFAVALAGVGAIALDGGGQAELLGDGLVLLSVLASAVFVVTQPALLAHRNALAVTAVQFTAAAVTALPFAAIGGAPSIQPPSFGAAVALAGLLVGGTLAPFTLFAFAQSRVSAEVAGSFLNLEPLVGVATGALAFGDPFGVIQLFGALAIVGGIALTTGAPSRRERAAVKNQVLAVSRA